MAKKTFFIKNFLSYASIVLVALLLAGMAFIHQLTRYSVDEKQAQLGDIARSAAQQTADVLDNYSLEYDRLYRVMLMYMVKDAEASILVTDPEGVAYFSADKTGVQKMTNTQVPFPVVRRLQSETTYAELGTLGGTLQTTSYVVGARAIGSDGTVSAFVFASAEDDAVNGMLQQVMRTFIAIVSMALVGILFMAYVSSSWITRPLKNMKNAAKEFAQGDFSVRVPVDNDCDEIDELAAAFNNMAGSLEQLEELTRGFIGNVSHEFKTPMTTIGGFVDGMLDGTIPEDQHGKYLRIISEEVHRLSRMVMRMLDAAKIQSGEILLAPAPFDFSEMASQIILSFEQKLGAKRVEVEVSLDDQLMVMGDRDHVFRAVYNLVDNAVKFVNEDGNLHLSAHAEGKDCAFSVVNTGGGISAEDLPHIFDRFYKADPSRSRDRTGAGLGLYIVKNIINLHGGDISVRSDGGETEFAFNIPLAQIKKGHDKNAEELTKRS